MTKQEVNSKVVHDLRKHLAVIKAGLDLIVDGLTGPVSDQQKDVLLRMQKNVDSLSRLILSLQEEQKPEGQKPPG
jgi:hypothetical protein